MASIIQQACYSIPEFKQRYEKFFKQLQVEQYSRGSITCYCDKLSRICLHFNKVPESLTEDELRDYFSMLLSRKPIPGISYFKHTVCGLRCYRKMMHLSELDLPLPSLPASKRLPVVLSMEEIRRFLCSCPGIRSKALFSLIYSCGLRRGELINLRIADIDSDRMRVFISRGKGNKDRYVPLSAVALSVLRRYFRQYRPSEYLFNSSPGKLISEQELGCMFHDALRCSRILKTCTPHTLRHSFATHLLEMGENIVRVKDLLGHGSIQMTMKYLHIAKVEQGGIGFSPLDKIFPVEPIASQAPKS